MSIFKDMSRNLKFELLGIIILIISALALGKFGSIGGSLAFFTKLFAGNWGFIIPLLGGMYALYLMLKRQQLKFNIRFYGILIFFIVLLIYSHLNLYTQLQGTVNSEINIISTTYDAIVESRTTEESIDLGGGLIGALCLNLSIYLFDISGTRLVLIGGLLIGLLLVTKLTIGDVLYNTKQYLQGIFNRLHIYCKNVIEVFKDKNNTSAKESYSSNQPEDKDENTAMNAYDLSEQIDKDISATKLDYNESQNELLEVIPKTDISDSDQSNLSYDFPSVQLLTNRITKQKHDANIANNIKKLEATLESFGVIAKVINYSQGPSVTRYELQPAIGVKVSKVINLTDDLALALAAKDIRMEAPIPGKAAIGIEVPNSVISIIGLKEVVDSNEFKNANSKLTIALGKDLAGNAIVADLAKMPHLLVAGSTGSGKSVCINGIITSILYKASPEEVKFFMIDPKMVELNVYNGIPHLVTPVVTDPRQASYLLKKVVQEMERRYKLFADHKARDIERYNYLIKLEKENNNKNVEYLPQIIVIIDELADLMMVAPGDVEDAICRIAQMARAAGIHLIIATQRPSVDVITGIIKANIPSRIAFSVASQTDSRTILDMGGAEKLLGRGDMLFLPVGASKPVRIQGAYISEDEIEEVVNFVKSQQQVKYNENLLNLESDINIEQEIEEQDELYEQAVELVVDAGQASVSYLQRKLKIGYARAARLIDAMEEQRVVGHFEGSKPRDVLLTKEQLLLKQQEK